MSRPFYAYLAVSIFCLIFGAIASAITERINGAAEIHGILLKVTFYPILSLFIGGVLILACAIVALFLGSIYDLLFPEEAESSAKRTLLSRLTAIYFTVVGISTIVGAVAASFARDILHNEGEFFRICVKITFLPVASIIALLIILAGCVLIRILAGAALSRETVAQA